MATSTQYGYLLLADISGFEAYMAGVELEHAQGIVHDLLNYIARSVSPPLQLASSSGDAILAHIPGDSLQRGEGLIEMAEAAYAGFRDQLNTIHRNTTCGCKACLAIPTLDLKFFLHYGEYLARPGIQGVELHGLPVTLLRERLLKDQARGSNCERAYLLVTDQSLEQMGISLEDAPANRSSYEHIGEVGTRLLDLGAYYDGLIDARRVYVERDQADFVFEHDYDAPVATLWEWLNDPSKRTAWMKWRTWNARFRPAGRMGVGAENHCAHGVGFTRETILDWRPMSYFTAAFRQQPVGVAGLQTYHIQPGQDGKGSRMQVHITLERPRPAWFRRLVVHPLARTVWSEDYEKLGRMMKAADVS